MDVYTERANIRRQIELDPNNTALVIRRDELNAIIKELEAGKPETDYVAHYANMLDLVHG